MTTTPAATATRVGEIGEGRPLTSGDVPLLQDGDVLQHRTDGQFVFSGRNKLNEGPAYLEVRRLGRPDAGWRMIAFTAFTFVHRPSRSAEQAAP